MTYEILIISKMIKFWYGPLTEDIYKTHMKVSHLEKNYNLPTDLHISDIVHVLSGGVCNMYMYMWPYLGINFDVHSLNYVNRDDYFPQLANNFQFSFKIFNYRISFILISSINWI